MVSLLTLNQKVLNEEILRAQTLDFPEKEPFNPRSLVERQKAQEIAITTNIPVDQVEAERAAGDESSQTIAKNEGLNLDYAIAIEQGYRDGLEVDEVAELIKDRTEKGEDMSIPEYLLIQNLMLADNDVSPAASRTLTNMTLWNNMLQRELEKNDQSGISKVLSFLDVNVLRELTIGAFENVTFRSNREGQDIRRAFNSLNAEEFEKWAMEYIEDRKEEGIFSEDSI